MVSVLWRSAVERRFKIRQAPHFRCQLSPDVGLKGCQMQVRGEEMEGPDEKTNKEDQERRDSCRHGLEGPLALTILSSFEALETTVLVAELAYKYARRHSLRTVGSMSLFIRPSLE